MATIFFLLTAFGVPIAIFIIILLKIGAAPVSKEKIIVGFFYCFGTGGLVYIAANTLHLLMSGTLIPGEDSNTFGTYLLTMLAFYALYLSFDLWDVYKVLRAG